MRERRARALRRECAVAHARWRMRHAGRAAGCAWTLRADTESSRRARAAGAGAHGTPREEHRCGWAASPAVHAEVHLFNLTGEPDGNVLNNFRRAQASAGRRRASCRHGRAERAAAACARRALKLTRRMRCAPSMRALPRALLHECHQRQRDPKHLEDLWLRVQVMIFVLRCLRASLTIECVLLL